MLCLHRCGIYAQLRILSYSLNSAKRMLTAESHFEHDVGITQYTTPGPGISGIHKQRYSDFIVREIMGGHISRLTSSSCEIEHTAFPKAVEPLDAAPAGTVNAEALFQDIALAYESNGLVDPTKEDVVGATSVREFLSQCERQDDECSVSISTHLVANNKSVRTALHAAFRKHTGKLVETSTDGAGEESRIRVTAVHKLSGRSKASVDAGNNANVPPKRAPQGMGWPKDLPDYLQFTLLKENVDTLNAVNALCRILRVKSQNAIGYAGTKDKRAVTAQQMTIYRRKPSELTRIHGNTHGFTVRVGDFRYVPQPVRLGNNEGNHFTITLRQVAETSEVVCAACEAVKQAGFINYYGLQRFGKATRKTHEFGRAWFLGQYSALCGYLFEESELDARSRTQASGGDIIGGKVAFRRGEYAEAQRLLPRSMHAEHAVLEGLLHSPTDFSGAFKRIPKYQRLMYLHAYQSYMWNLAASERVRRYGLQVVAGDLVLTHKAATGAYLQNAGEPTSGEAPLEAALEEENGGTSGDLSSTARVHCVTAHEVAAGIYTIAEVVLPLYGNSVQFPQYADDAQHSSAAGAAFYETLLTRDGLQPQDILSNADPTCRMSGAYRYLVQIPRDMQYDIIAYADPNAELTDTELTAVRARAAYRPTPPAVEGLESTVQNNASVKSLPAPQFTGLRLAFSLSPGAYATMLLRELSKASTESMFQAQLSAAAVAAMPLVADAVTAGDKETRERDSAEEPCKRQKTGN